MPTKPESTPPAPQPQQPAPVEPAPPVRRWDDGAKWDEATWSGEPTANPKP